MFKIKTNLGWIKHTCRCGPFYGTLQYTDDTNLARVWTREYDAKRFMKTIGIRARLYPHDKNVGNSVLYEG